MRQRTIVHEFGHMLNLNDEYDTQPASSTTSLATLAQRPALKLTFEVDHSGGPIRDLVMTAGSGRRLKSLQVSAGHLRSSHEQSSALDFQTGPFRSHRHHEVATSGLLAYERAEARSLIEDQHCR